MGLAMVLLLALITSQNSRKCGPGEASNTTALGLVWEYFSSPGSPVRRFSVHAAWVKKPQWPPTRTAFLCNLCVSVHEVGCVVCTAICTETRGDGPSTSTQNPRAEANVH